MYYTETIFCDWECYPDSNIGFKPILSISSNWALQLKGPAPATTKFQFETFAKNYTMLQLETCVVLFLPVGS